MLLTLTIHQQAAEIYKDLDSGEQLCREADRPATAGNESARVRRPKSWKNTPLSDEQTPTRSKSSTDPPETDVRFPRPKLVRPLRDVTQPDIFTFLREDRPLPLTIVLQPLLLPNPNWAKRPELLGTQLTATG